jgi:uncharacterized delta-60 repeat protein
VINNLTLDDDINDVALQPDGRIVFVGFSDSTTVSSAAFVARLNADGSRDGSFAGNGVNTFDIGVNSDANAKAVLIDGGGRVLVGGSGRVGQNDQGFVARFTSGGAFDDTFAGDGLLNLQFALLGESVNGLALDAAGNIYTAGTIVVGADTSRVLVRKLLPSGSGGASGFSGDGAWVVPGTLSGSSFGPIPVLADGAVHVGAPGASARRLNVDPAVVDLELLFETAPQRLRVQFNDDVSATLADADVTVRNTTTSQTLSITTYDLASFDAATNTAILQFNSILPDGDYTATLSGITVENRQGMRLGGDRTREFFFLMGDANRDKRVNLADFNLLAANFGQSNRTFTRADFTYDGQVNLADFNVLASRFGSSLGAASRANGERGYDGTGVPGDDYPDDLLA